AKRGVRLGGKPDAPNGYTARSRVGPAPIRGVAGAPGQPLTPLRRERRPERRSAGGHRRRLLDRHADHAAPLGPAAVVVADPLVAEQLVEDEPGVARPLADPAVGDDVLVGRDALGLVEVLELLAGLERAVLANGLSPRDRGGAGNVAGALRGLAHPGWGDDLAVELGRRPDVDQGEV